MFTHGALSGLLVALAVGALVVPTHAQSQEADFLSVGTAAPEVVIPGGTRHGVLQNDIRLSDYQGETVVLVFFFRARTKG